ncbi:MAG: hypothetical protein ACOZAN_03055 [Patescibacteria group bacterium]
MIFHEESRPIGFKEKLHNIYQNILVIMSPPRCASTALARFFWHQSLFRYYSHEPYETTYYKKENVLTAQSNLLSPIDLNSSYRTDDQTLRNGLIIKEMPYQVGDNFPDLISYATLPLLFLIRDPRLSIKSRIDKKIIASQSTNFPFIETGWELMKIQIDFCQQKQVPFIICDSTDMRNNPSAFFSLLCTRLNMPFNSQMLNWKPAEQINLDNLGGEHSHLYLRVLKSSGIEPANEPIPSIKSFSNIEGLSEHVCQAMEIYSFLKNNKHTLRIDNCESQRK